MGVVRGASVSGALDTGRDVPASAPVRDEDEPTASADDGRDEDSAPTAVPPERPTAGSGALDIGRGVPASAPVRDEGWGADESEAPGLDVDCGPPESTAPGREVGGVVVAGRDVGVCVESPAVRVLSVTLAVVAGRPA
ncbi:hypothetical protein ORV05_01540 [Amycolatopsis cynarae]|uniref:Uncharacterized protein n=1 Tax=Amycolatopsis cynarae TaxID=2995223 RepID=A0ABY7B2K4_9PSEU|nr:hypothetical protein [Amycolatopsis sp. HUAS 11-8]WAL66529.1 hypothetical protein ORV05_01540 [Amycolatopsis sp. HUAS 11-8]